MPLVTARKDIFSPVTSTLAASFIHMTAHHQTGSTTAEMKMSHGRKGQLQDQRVTECKVCRWGIFTSQPRQWSVNPVGLIHTECATRPDGGENRAA
jgi:hypothetical protein